ncbi:MAG: transglutaminase domain-containing protein [Promethearchaeota archaeon]|nr:MAG: transglutaminase domain-containing protein [Candidatus Lokiarchaeota archaeon]
MSIYLQPTEFLDFHKTRVKNTAIEITKDLKTDKEKAIALFYWVQNEIKYNMFTYYPKIKANLKASVTLRRKNGFCMSKATLLSTFARAVGIPARIHMVDIINHKISKRVVNLMGTNAFHCHAYSELYLNGKWIKATPVFDKETSIKGGFLPIIKFDGENDALFDTLDKDGNLFVEYIEDWGNYADVPIEKIDQIFTEKYPQWYNGDISIFQKQFKMRKEPLTLNK